MAFALILAALPSLADRDGVGECVALLHGLGRTRHSMDRLADALASAGYATVNLDYPSRRAPIEQLALRHLPDAIAHCRLTRADRIHFVTHSMGALVLRYYLSHRSVEGLGRVVMLSPPNQGSEVADALREWPIYRWLNGPAGQQLGTGPAALAAALGPVDYPVGVITGSRHTVFDAWNSARIPGQDDGKVSIERAKVEGMADFLVLPYTHTFIMRQDSVIGETLHFLRHGRFKSPHR